MQIPLVSVLSVVEVARIDAEKRGVDRCLLSLHLAAAVVDANQPFEVSRPPQFVHAVLSEGKEEHDIEQGSRLLVIREGSIWKRRLVRPLRFGPSLIGDSIVLSQNEAEDHWPEAVVRSWFARADALDLTGEAGIQAYIPIALLRHKPVSNVCTRIPPSVQPLGHRGRLTLAKVQQLVRDGHPVRVSLSPGTRKFAGRPWTLFLDPFTMDQLGTTLLSTACVHKRVPGHGTTVQAQATRYLVRACNGYRNVVHILSPGGMTVVWSSVNGRIGKRAYP